jgi:YjbE family integral membrane protein
MQFPDLQTWGALAEIIGVNIVLSGDNAVVIALAARSLPRPQQKKAVIFGSLAAIVMRVLLTLVAAKVLTLPWLRIAGSALLLWIGIKLLVPEEGEGGAGESRQGGMFAAIRTILIADLVMSLDNVIAVAAAAKGSIPLLIIGLAVSIPLIIFGSTLILKLMDRFPVIVTLGAALLGFVAGEMVIGDSVIAPWVDEAAAFLHYLAPAAGAVMVVIAGRFLAARARTAMASAPMVDLAEKEPE